MKTTDAVIQAIKNGRRIGPNLFSSKSLEGEAPSIGKLLQGTWESENRGWNLIALPHAPAEKKFRLLMNQYQETLTFRDIGDLDVPNRGIEPETPDPLSAHQLLDALEYQQVVKQVSSDEFPVGSGLMSNDKEGIHHEPGLFLQLRNHQPIQGGMPLSLVRLATIPHGNSVLAQGTQEVSNALPEIPDLDAFPQHLVREKHVEYLAPYHHFTSNPFKGALGAGFPGFSPSNANALLQLAAPADVKRTFAMHFDTQWADGGILNIPFVNREANAAEMSASFWVMETSDGQWIMQYTQTVMLDFFPSPDVAGKRIRWPHVSINTLNKIS